VVPISNSSPEEQGMYIMYTRAGVYSTYCTVHSCRSVQYVLYTRAGVYKHHVIVKKNIQNKIVVTK
jgi:hypothetical protein